MPDEFQSPELDKLPTDVRARVETALKETLEQSLASEATSPGKLDSPMAGHSRSRGAFFSRSKTTQLQMEDSVIVDQVTKLDDDAFEKFASRLAQLKNLNNPG
ncbi:hypothetical protein ACIOHS_34640 [Streptomyces sp. NPDC088253]|uniref:hypothetical protein n=1 Tax=Streptomyces sp. NPDC088253 TaxID=3365846 RepID=UPI0038184501